jgi:trehalose-6-phosphate synthase
MYLVYISPLPRPARTYDFIVLTSLTHPNNILLVVLQIGKQEIGKAKDLSAPICISICEARYSVYNFYTYPVHKSLVVVSQVMFTNQKVVLGVDRLDYTKGLVHRLKLFEKLLEKHPEHIEKVRYMHTL